MRGAILGSENKMMKNMLPALAGKKKEKKKNQDWGWEGRAFRALLTGVIRAMKKVEHGP